MKKLIIIISMLFSVAYGQTCDTVTNLTFSLVTTSTARVTWTHATNKISYNWALYCLSGCGGIAQQSGNTAGNTLNLSGLNSSFAYQFCITTYCGATSSTPKCSNFTTLSPQIQYTPMTAAGYQFKYVKVDTGFNIPLLDTSIRRGINQAGAMVCLPSNKKFYGYNGSYWELIQGVNSAANKVDSVIINNAGDSLFYWINGTSYGQVFGGASSRWSILGNSGTVAGTNFLGTTDSVRLDLRTNNTIRQSITESGNVGIGTASPISKFQVDGTIRGTDSLVLTGLGSTTDSTDFKVIGINSSGNVKKFPYWITGSGGAAIDTANKWVNTITRTAGKDSIIFYVGTTRYAIKDSVGGGAGAWSTSGDNYTTGRLSVGTSSIYTGATLSIKGVDNDALNGLYFKPNNESISTQMGWGGISSGWVYNILGAGPVSLGTSGAYDATFLTSNAVRMTIASGGNVGIGTTTPTAVVHIKAGTTAASTAPLKLTTGTVNTTAEAGAMEYTTPQLFFTNGGLQRQEIFMGQQSRTTSQFDKTSSTTLSDVTGLTATVVAGKTYRFEATCYTTSNDPGGVKFSIAGTATATTFVAGSVDALTNYPATRIITTMGSVIADQTSTTSGTVIITGTITVNTAGTLTVQFAQNASNGTASSVLVGSTLVVTEML